MGIYLVCKTRGKAGNELSTSLKQQNTKNRGQTREEQGFALHAMRADLFSTQLHGLSAYLPDDLTAPRFCFLRVLLVSKPNPRDTLQ